MRKIIIAGAVACAAMLAQAASYSWTATGTAFWNNENATFDELSGYTVYAFDASQASKSSVVSALSSGDTSVLSGALGSTAIDGYEFLFSGTGINDDGGSPAYINSYLVLLTTEISGQKYFSTYDIAPIEVTDAVVGGGATLSTGDGWAFAELPGAGAAGWTATPEPTSGLLVLLGLAGLALRRKRA